MKGIKDNNGRFIKNASYVERKCMVCHNLFLIKESSLKYGRGKYCSRKCCDIHKQTICIGNGNGAFGRKAGEQERKMRSTISTKMWLNPLIKKKIKNSLYEFQWKNGYWPGSDKRSCAKRRETFINKYGVEHGWKLKEMRDKANKTCLQLYGKTAYELMIDALNSCHSTKIEIIIENILNQNKIDFIKKFKLQYKSSYREYDFYIPSKKLLIEADGDFWHGNPNKYNKNLLLEVQKINKENDILKEKLAIKNNKKIIRFWESDIFKKDFKFIFLNTINNYENVTS